MKNTLIVLCAVLIQLVGKAQADTNHASYEHTEELKELLEEHDIQDLKYVDSTFMYSAEVPSWLSLMETGDPTSWGGIFPKVNGIQNALIVKGYPKSAFKNFEEFQDIYLTGNSFGKPVKWGAEQTWFGQNELIEIENGVKQTVYIMMQGLIYHNRFVLLESPTAFIFIQFTATPETYTENIEKFEKFLERVEIFK